MGHPMKNVLFKFETLSENDPAAKKIKSAFLKLGCNVVEMAVGKPKRSAGVSYKEFDFTFADSQRVTARIKPTGDVYQVLLNGSVLPLKNQDEHQKAIEEIASKLDGGRAAFQKKLARTKVTIPAGIRNTVKESEQALTEQRDALKEVIADLEKKIEEATEALK